MNKEVMDKELLKKDLNTLTMIRNSNNMRFGDICIKILFLKTIPDDKKVNILKTYSNAHLFNINQEIINPILNKTITELERCLTNC